MRTLAVALAALALLPAAAHAAGRPGTLDRTFGRGGVATSSAMAGAGQLLIDRRGRILVSGGGNVLRLTPGGRHDRRYGTAGLARSPYGPTRAVGIRRVKDGGTVVTTLGPPESGVVERLRLLRYGPRGTLRGTLERDPLELPQFSTFQGLRADGRLFFGVFSDRGLLAFTPSGRLDRRFAASRLCTGVRYCSLDDLIALPDGGALAIRETGERQVRRVIRITARGAVAGAFRSPVLEDYQLYSLRRAPDGSLLYAGVQNDGDVHALRVTRLRPDGRLDRRFGRGGTATVLALRKGWPDFQDLRVDGRGRIYVLAANAAGDGVYGVVRLSARGTVSTRFGTDGRAIVPPAPGLGDEHYASRLAFDRRGGLLVAGGLSTETSDGCFRSDVCDVTVAARIWRFRR